jgi:hypothetical protein
MASSRSNSSYTPPRVFAMLYQLKAFVQADPNLSLLQKKEAQKNYFERTIKTFSVAELTSLCELMVSIHNNTIKDEYFGIIRSETDFLRSWMGDGKGSTVTWQLLIHRVKEELMHKLVFEKAQPYNPEKPTVKIALSKEEYHKYLSLVSQHTGRLPLQDLFTTADSATKFKEIFADESASFSPARVLLGQG